MTNQEPQTRQERGEHSREAYGDADSPREPQDTRQQPRLSHPAEGTAGPGRDDGLGQKRDGDNADARPVPSGDPNTESDRSDLQ